jgi:putative membrane protein
MTLEIIISVLAGIFLGIIAGLIPGLHINLLSLMATSIILQKLQLTEIEIIFFFVSMALTSAFIEFIPSIFLGAPDEDSFLSVLPGHHLLNEGKGYLATVYSSYGGLFSAPLFLLIIAPAIIILPRMYYSIERVMPIALIALSVFIIFSQKNNKLYSLLIYILSGILGIVTINLNLDNSLLPMLTGLFGISTITLSFLKKQKISPQKIIPLKKIPLDFKTIKKIFLTAGITSPFCSFLPGLGNSQAAILSSWMIEKLKSEYFLFLLGILSSLNASLSFLALFIINKARTGVALSLSSLIRIEKNEIKLIIILVLFLLPLLFFISIALAKIFSRLVNKINYTILNAFTLILLVNITLIFSGVFGFFILISSSLLGILCNLLGIRKTTLMGSIIIPTILLYLL